MANPEIQLAWGGGGWPSSQRKIVRPTVQTAIDFCGLTYDEIGLSYRLPKVVNVWRCGRNEDTWGTSDGPTSIDLHVRADHIKHRKVGLYFAEYALATGHELAHAVRSEYFNFRSLIEDIASEGIANVIEDTLDRVIFGDENSMLLADLKGLYSSDDGYSEIRKRLLQNRDHSWSADAKHDEIRDFWLETGGDTPPDGLIVGITEVQRRLQEGNTILELMAMPAEHILDLNPRELQTIEAVNA